MLWIYSLFMYFLSPYLFIRLWWKGRRLPAYRERIFERFCWDKAEYPKIDIWVHAVSLGEVIAATPLIEAFLSKNKTILVTTMTPTGSAQVKLRFKDKVAHRYVPYDLPDVVNRFFKTVKPQVGVIMETELWPNLIHQAKLAKVPLLIANARLSERSLHGYMRFDWFFKPILRELTAILAQSKEDGERFQRLGARPEAIQVLGSIKFDLQTHSIDSAKFDDLKRRWGSQRVALIIASTHEDEESHILEHLKRLQHAIPNVVLLIAPRHPERFPVVYQLCIQKGWKTGLRSNLASLSEENEVVVLDCLGELLGLYQISDYAFVGGSLVPVGGHNVLEPIAMRVPVFSGKQVHNFKTICSDLVKAKAIQLVSEASELIEAIILVHHDAKLKQQMVNNATRVLEENKGALDRHLQRISIEME